jgi:5-methylcytosine-specific restriction enzyme A
MSDRITGRKLTVQYSLPVLQAMYSKDGIWFHRLRSFPGALCDSGGYVIFEAKTDYLMHQDLTHGPDPNHLHVTRGIKNIREYRPFSKG